MLISCVENSQKFKVS